MFSPLTVFSIHTFGHLSILLIEHFARNIGGIPCEPIHLLRWFPVLVLSSKFHSDRYSIEFSQRSGTSNDICDFIIVWDIMPNRIPSSKTSNSWGESPG